MTRLGPPQSAPRRRGVTLMLALIMLALFGVALAALSRQLAAEARRTRDALHEAQQRQLLLAAHTIARSQLAAGTAAPAAAPAALQLPERLGASNVALTLRWNQVAPSAAEAQIELTDGLPQQLRAQLHETARFAPTPQGWALQDLPSFPNPSLPR